MNHVLTFNNIYLSDVDKVGQRAIDLATLEKRHFNVPLGFVIDAQALERFIDFNDLEERAERWLRNDDFDTLVEQTTKGQMPREVRSDIHEAYNSVGIEEDDAEAIVEDENDTPVTVIASPNYTTQNYAVKLHVQGLNSLLHAVKEVWASLLTEEEFNFRRDRGITEFYAGTIVVQTPACEKSATASTRPDQEEIIVTTRFGQPDFSDSIVTDRFAVDKASLSITSHNVNRQEEKIQRTERVRFGRGDEQTTDDKTVIEIGRLTKKMSNQLDEGITAHYCLDDDITVLLADRQLREEWFDIDAADTIGDEDVVTESYESSETEHPKRDVLNALRRKVDELEEHVLDDEPYDETLRAVEDILRQLRT